MPKLNRLFIKNYYIHQIDRYKEIEIIKYAENTKIDSRCKRNSLSKGVFGYL
jgi:hypothetical protein